MNADQLLVKMGRRYLWWRRGEADTLPSRRIVAQLMNIGDYDDVLAALELLGRDAFLDALRHAEAGWFSAKSWSYWHLRLGLRKPGEPAPPLPQRETVP